jgi:hypothetical protein
MVSLSDAPSSTVATMQQQQQLQPSPPHTRLYANVLGCIFACLAFDELRSAMMACRSWLAVVYSMPGLDAGGKSVMHNGNPPTFANMLVSRLSRHIATIHFFSTSLVGVKELAALSRSSMFACLRKMSFHTCKQWDRPCQVPVLFPRSLEQIDVSFRNRSSFATINAVIASISQLPSLHSLLVRMPLGASIDPSISFSPLQQAHSLKSFYMDGFHAELSHLLPIRQLQQLSSFQVRLCSTNLFVQLLQQHGPPLQWKGLANSDISIEDTLAALLPSTLPCIDSISLRHEDLLKLHSLQLLPQMRALITLTIQCVGCIDTENMRIAQVLLSMVEPLPQLKHLWFTGLPFESTQLQRWLLLTPHLEKLHIAQMNVESLAFLSVVRDTLQSLDLSWCLTRSLEPQELLTQLQDLRHLSNLKLYKSLGHRLSDHSLQTLKLLLPGLSSFEYTPPDN